MLLFPLILLIMNLGLGHTAETSFVFENQTIGMKKEDGETCMSVTFQVEILNEQNNNSVPIDFHLPSGLIKGKCAADRKSEAVISSTIEEADGRLKTLKFVFRTEEMRVKRVDELRWQLNKVVYVEKFAGSSAVFESDNSSVIFSAPLTQKYVCEDRINVTLHSENFDFPILVMFSLKSMFNPMVQRVISISANGLENELFRNLFNTVLPFFVASFWRFPRSPILLVTCFVAISCPIEKSSMRIWTDFQLSRYLLDNLKK